MAISEAELRNIFQVLFDECLGFVHLRIALRLDARLRYLPPERQVSPVFFYMSRQAHQHAAILRLIRLFDNHPKTVTIDLLLRKAEKEAHLFPYTTQRALREAVAKDRQLVQVQLRPLLSRLESRRNTHIAHLSKALTEGGIRAIEQRYPIFLDELQSLYETVAGILSRYFAFLFGETHSFDYVACEEDVEYLFDFLAQHADISGGNA